MGNKAAAITSIFGFGRDAVRHCITLAAKGRAIIEAEGNGIEVYSFNDGSKVRINMNELKIID